jgi:Protein O-mannosyl-transferase TMEM260-like
VFAIAMVVYLRTLLPGQAFDDWGEMQVVPHVLGIPHPTGYPTYVLVAWLFELLPVGSIAFRANLLSAVCIAVALAALVSVQQRLGVRPVVAAGAALAAGFTGSIWSSATVAEVNALHLAFIGLILDRALAWAQNQRFRDLALGGLLIGLSMGNHVLTAFTAPFVILFVLWTGRVTLSEHKAWILTPIATMALGGAVYLYLPIAASFNPPLPYNSPTDLESFLFLVLGEQFSGQYRGLLTPEGPGNLISSLPDLGRLMGERATLLFPILALLGVVPAFRRNTAFAAVLVATILTGIYVWANYLRLEHYLLVPWLTMGILVGLAIDAAGDLVAGFLTEGLRPIPGAVVAMLALGVAAMLLVVNLPRQDLSGNRGTEQYVDDMLALLPQDAAVLSFWGASPPLWYAQLVDGRRADVLVVDDTNIVYEGWGSREARIQSLICERPVFLIRGNGRDVDLTRAAGYEVAQVGTVVSGGGGPLAGYTLPVYQVERPTVCP